MPVLKGLFTEIGDYLYTRYICLDLSEYQYFSLGAKNTVVAQFVLMCIFGCMLASIFIYVEKRSGARLVGALVKNGCVDENTAKTEKELGIRLSWRQARALRRPSALSKLVYYKGQPYMTASPLTFDDQGDSSFPLPNAPGDWTLKDELSSRKSVDFHSVPLYIPSTFIYRSEVRYSASSPRPLHLALSLVLFPTVGFLILRLFPYILSLADRIIHIAVTLF